MPGITNQFKVEKPTATLYLFIFISWFSCLIWFEPRLLLLLNISHNLPGFIALLFLIIFINIAWLYGLYNLWIVIFAIYYRTKHTTQMKVKRLETFPPVAVLYTTCNDFSYSSAQSCIRQDYPHYKVYILDDSSQLDIMKEIDDFQKNNSELVTVIRRTNRHAYKAGNLNNGLEFLKEKYFAIADADEFLPTDFLSKTVPVLESDDNCGFVQANHRANPATKTKFSKAMGVGIDIHWEWYQPLRNKFGFVMFLGHGALLRRSCWVEIGGFPEIVSEDLGYAIRIRELGYRGYFMKEVICFEDFPDTVRAFRIRHMKWTRGTCEFLSKEFLRLIKAKKITWQEKMDILFPTLNLPLTLLFFCFMVNANLVLPYLFSTREPVTFVSGQSEYVLNMIQLHKGFGVINSLDFYIITTLTFISPVLCFILALANKPLKLFRFLSHSTALYAALSPLSSIGVIGYMLTGKATFLVTGDKQYMDTPAPAILRSQVVPISMKRPSSLFFTKSHPDQNSIQLFEIITGLVLGLISILMFQISFFGLCIAFILLPVMHRLGWDNIVVRIAVYLPFLLILTGLLLSSLNLIGIQSVFFGYGFHF